MAILLLSFMFSFPVLPANSGAPTLHQVRELYVNAAKNEEACLELISILKPYNETNNALYLGYKASATMMMAKHSLNPFTKFSWFKKGKKMMETAINTSPKNVELRCLRFAAQSNIPSFLGYHENIHNDKSFILEQYPYVKDQILRRNIVTFLTKWGKLSPAESDLLK